MWSEVHQEIHVLGVLEATLKVDGVGVVDLF